MAVHNWVRCHWRNGRHDLHDLPQAWRETVESHLARQRARAADLGVVRVATVDSLELAWVECEVSLGPGECGFTYRRARAIHALVRPTAQGGAWRRPEVESLLGQRYGEPVERGLPAQHAALSHLRFPEDAKLALGLFVGRAELLPSELSAPPCEPATPEDAPSDPVPVAERAAAAATLVAPCEPSPAGPDVERSSPEDWFRRFKLISPLEPTVDRGAPATQAAPVATEVAEVGEAGEIAEPNDVGPEASVFAAPAPPTLPPQLGEHAEQHEEQHEEQEEREGQDDQTPPLFDLSVPSVHRPAAPPSSLSGLLGPSHTAVW